MFYKKFSRKKLKIAHRGYRAVSPENTIYAFQEAVGVFDLLEIDIQLTKDNKWIVMHDDTLERTTNIENKYRNNLRPNRVSDYTLNEIKTLDATSWFLNLDPFNQLCLDKNLKVKIEKLKPISPPSLKETLEFCVKFSMPINIEIKDMPCKNSDFVTNLLINELKEYLDRVDILISSFNHQYVSCIKNKDNRINIALNMEQTTPDNLIRYIKKTDAEALHIDSKIVNKIDISELMENNITVSIFTINDKKEQDRYYNMGIRAIFMDKL